MSFPAKGMPCHLWTESLRAGGYELGMPPDAVLLIVDAGTQRMYFSSGIRIERSFPVSTARKGLGEEENSYRTPRGFHRVEEWIGADAPTGSVFTDRLPTGEIVKPADRLHGDEDLILTRILRLRGLEEGFNAGPGVDSYARYIYIHGTNRESEVGRRPGSCGCIRMRNEDVEALFAITQDRPTWVWIGLACVD